MKCIEGDRLALQTQKFFFAKKLPPETRLTLEGHSVRVYPFTMERGGRGEVAKESAPPPPVARFCASAGLARGSYIEAKRLSGWAKDRPGAYEVGQSGRTGGHSGQSLVVSDYCFLMSVVDFTGVPVDIGMDVGVGLSLAGKIGDQKLLG